jgi:hypothetical protein
MITKILRNGPRAHFPFNLPLFGDLCQHNKKQLKEVQHQCKWEYKFVLIQIWHIWIILCHHLVCFLQIKLNFLPLSQSHLLRHRERYSKRNWLRIQKLPLFPIINHSPHKRLSIRDNKSILTNQRALLYYFQNSQVVADPFLALALFSPPLASSTKTGPILALKPHCLTKIFK